MKRITKIVFTCILLLSAAYAKSDGLIGRQTNELIQRGVFKTEYHAFNIANNTDYKNYSEVISKYQLLSIAKDYNSILQSKPDYVKLTIPSASGSLTLLLYKVNISPNGFTLLTSNGETVRSTVVNYRGVVEGDLSSAVSFSFSEEETMGLLITKSGNYVLGKVEGLKNIYMIYNDKDLVPSLSFDCPTDVSVPANYSQRYAPGSTVTTTKCVNWYWETDYDLYVNKGNSSANVNSFIQGVFNQVATLYANDGMSITLQTLYIWTAADPYTGPSTSDYLTQFGTNRTSFSGDLANLIGTQGGGGIAWINGLCNNQAKYKMAYSGISSSYNNVPTYSWTVEVLAHEEGHLLGSRHTHDCAWNGNNTRIDGCGPAAGYTTGTCATGPIPVKGTIMSYCHLVSGVGIDLTLGFGPQPTTLMVNNINNASCLQACGTACASPSQPSSITGNTVTCQGTSLTYSVPAVATATSYIWTLPSGWSGSSTSNSITIVAGSAGGTISVVAVNSCGNSTARTASISINALPSTPASITVSKSGKVCAGDIRTYTSTAPTGATLNWTVPTGAVITNGVGTGSITVQYNSAFTSSGTISVVAVNSCGSSTARTLTVTRNTPGTPGVMTGTFSGVCNQQGIIYSVPAVSGMTYTWTVPSGATFSGQGSNSITVNYPSTNLSGSITVAAVNSCGSGSQRTMAVKTVPAAAASIIGNTSVCPNTNGNQYSIAAIPSATSYTWTGPSGSHISDGNTTSASNTLTTTAAAVTVNFAALGSAPRIQVKASNNCGTGANKTLTLSAGICRVSDIEATSFNVYPNPTTGKVTLSLNSMTEESFVIEVLDITGKTVYVLSRLAEEGMNSIDVDLGELEKGIYIVKVKSGQDSYTRKLELL